MSSSPILDRLQYLSQKHIAHFNPEELVAELYTLRNELKTELQALEPQSRPVHIKDVLDESLKRVLSPEGFGHGNILSGFKDLDEITKGFSPGELIIVGARPGTGKTFFLVNLCLKIGRAHV